MENRDWNVVLRKKDDWEVGLHGIEVVTPQLLEEILKNAYDNGAAYVLIDIGWKVEGYSFVLTNDYTYGAENWIIQEKYQKLGLHMNYTF